MCFVQVEMIQNDVAHTDVAFQETVIRIIQEALHTFSDTVFHVLETQVSFAMQLKCSKPNGLTKHQVAKPKKSANVSCTEQDRTVIIPDQGCRSDDVCCQCFVKQSCKEPCASQCPCLQCPAETKMWVRESLWLRGLIIATLCLIVFLIVNRLFV